MRFLRYMLFRSRTNEATDRFMRDTVCSCHGAQRFLLLHHLLHDQRPVFSGKTVCGVFWPWSPFAHHRRRADVICTVVGEHVLDLEIQCASRGKEEI